MAKRIPPRDATKGPTFARSLYDSTLPLDVVFAGTMAATQRPGILSERAEQEEEEDDE